MLLKIKAEEKLGVENIYDLSAKKVKGKLETKIPTNEKIKTYKKCKKFVYTHKDIIIPIIMSTSSNQYFS